MLEKGKSQKLDLRQKVLRSIHVRKMVEVLISILVEKLSRQKRLECLKSREKLFSHKKKKSLTLSF